MISEWCFWKAFLAQQLVQLLPAKKQNKFLNCMPNSFLLKSQEKEMGQGCRGILRAKPSSSSQLCKQSSLQLLDRGHWGARTPRLLPPPWGLTQQPAAGVSSVPTPRHHAAHTTALLLKDQNAPGASLKTIGWPEKPADFPVLLCFAVWTYNLWP